MESNDMTKKLVKGADGKMKLVVAHKEGKTQTTYKDSPEAEPVEVASETVTGPLEVFTAEPFRVVVGLDAKIGLPNYSSAGCFVSLSCPCTEEEVETTYTEALKWVEEKMAEITSGIGS